MPYNVEIYGHPGAGKTILLNALFSFVSSPDVEGEVGKTSPELNNRFKMLAQNEFPGRTDLGMIEYLTLQLPGAIDMTITAHAGEEHTADEDATQVIKEQFLENQKETLLVVVVNPFLHDERLAWKAFRNSAAYLQRQINCSIKEACYSAANILFGLSQDAFLQYNSLQMTNTFVTIRNMILEYDINELDSEECFQLTLNGQATNAKPEFNKTFKPAIESIVMAHQDDRLRLRQLMNGLENSLLVLSHVDLADKLHSIRVEDFEPVFTFVFRTPNRNYRRQLLARNLQLQISYHEGQIKIEPGQIKKDSAKQFYNNIKSFATEEPFEEPLTPSQVIYNVPIQELVTQLEKFHDKSNPFYTQLERIATGIEQINKDFGNTQRIANGIEQSNQDFGNIHDFIPVKQLGELVRSLTSISISFNILQGTFNDKSSPFYTQLEKITTGIEQLNKNKSSPFYTQLEKIATGIEQFNKDFSKTRDFISVNKLDELIKPLNSISGSLKIIVFIIGFFCFITFLSMIS